jgi:hypothetical protein
MTRDDALEALRQAYALVQPPTIDERGRQVSPDRSCCLCQLSPRVVAWLIEHLEEGA